MRDNAAGDHHRDGPVWQQRNAIFLFSATLLRQSRPIDSLDALIRCHVKDMFRGGQKCSMGRNISPNSPTRIRLANTRSFTVQGSWRRCEHSKKSSGPISPSTWRPVSTRMIPKPDCLPARLDAQEGWMHKKAGCTRRLTAQDG
jgi:hypothetical protein